MSKNKRNKSGTIGAVAVKPIDSIYQSLLQALPEGIVIFDSRGFIHFYNHSAQKMFFPRGRKEFPQRIVDLFQAFQISSSSEGEVAMTTEQWLASEVISRQKRFFRQHKNQKQILSVMRMKWDQHSKSEQALIIQDISSAVVEEEHRTRFIKIIGHELKHPLASLKAYLFLMKKKMGQIPESLQQYFDKSEVQIDQLTQMLNDLTDVSKINLRQFQVTLQLLDLGPLVKQIVSELRPVYRQHRLVAPTIKQSVWVLADEIRLRQVMTNLVANAARYSEVGTPIHIELKMQDNEAVLSVTDQGVGIEAAQTSQVFLPYFRGSNAGQTGKKGLGLGLFIAQEIVRQHGGEISVKSDSEGSTFTLFLPLAPAELRP